MKRFIIPIFIPHDGCPHQCVFCDQRAITGVRTPIGAKEVAAIIKEHLAMITEPRLIEIAFYGGSFTALPAARQVELLSPAKEALACGRVQAIRLSTRPDAIDEAVISRLKQFGVQTVELGAQSFDDTVLAAAGRGHGAGDTYKAVKLLQQAGFDCGLQLMPGLPHEDWLSLIRTAKEVIALKPSFVRVYPTVVLRDTYLADMFRCGQYKPLSFTEAVSRAAYLKIVFDNAAIPIIRFGLQATEQLSGEGAVMAGPYHPAFGEAVAAYIFYLMVCHYLEQVSRQTASQLFIRHHPKDHSRLRGLSSNNLKKWRAKFGIKEFILKPDWHKPGEIAILSCGINYIINTAILNNC